MPFYTKQKQTKPFSTAANDTSISNGLMTVNDCCVSHVFDMIWQVTEQNIKMMNKNIQRTMNNNIYN